MRVMDCTSETCFHLYIRMIVHGRTDAWTNECMQTDLIDSAELLCSVAAASWNVLLLLGHTLTADRQI